MAKTAKPKPSRTVAARAPDAKKLLGDLREIIESGRGHVARAVNAGMVLLYWGVGDRIRREILGEKRAKYGEQIVATVSQQLAADYGRGFSRRNLFNMIRLAEVYADLRIVQTLSAQLSWSHFMEVIQFDDQLKRDFYVEICRIERWSVRTLRQKIQGILFERTAISRKPENLAERELAKLRDSDQMNPPSGRESS